MVTEPLPPDGVENLRLNTLGDGHFHAFTWLMTTIGLAMLWRASRRSGVTWSGKILVFLAFGAILVGAGWALTRTAPSDSPVASKGVRAG